MWDWIAWSVQRVGYGLDDSAEATDFGPLQSIQTGSGAHPTPTEWVLGGFPWK